MHKFKYMFFFKLFSGNLCFIPLIVSNIDILNSWESRVWWVQLGVFKKTTRLWKLAKPNHTRPI